MAVDQRRGQRERSARDFLAEVLGDLERIDDFQRVVRSPRVKQTHRINHGHFQRQRNRTDRVHLVDQPNRLRVFLLVHKSALDGPLIGLQLGQDRKGVQEGH